MKGDPPKGLTRWRGALGHSMSGLRDAWRREAAFREETVALIVAVPLVGLIADSVSQSIALIASLLFLMVIEILNSAIEAIVDRIGPERHELSRVAKDLGSAAVLVAFLLALGVWSAVILSRLGILTW